MVKRINPYKVSTKDLRHIKVHKDLVNALEKEARKHQRISDNKYGKNRYKVPRTFASKVLGGFLK